MISIILSVLIGSGLAIGDFFMKKWSLLNYSWSGQSLLYVLSGLLTYSASLIGYGYLLKYFNLNVATLIVVIVNVIIVIMVGSLLFEETINIYHAIGITLCLIGLLLIYLK